MLNFYGAAGAIDPKSFNDKALGIFDDKGNPEVSNVNLEGKSLREGLALLLEPHNYLYSIDTITQGGNALQRIRFSYRGEGTEANVRLEPFNTQATLSKSNMISCQITEDSTSTVNCIDGYGDRILITTLASTQPDPGSDTQPLLVKGWKDADLVWPTTTFSDGGINYTEDQFNKNYRDNECLTNLDDSSPSVYGIGRMWVVNLGESPSYAIEDLNADLSGPNSVDPRRFEKPSIYNTTSAGGFIKAEDVVVEISMDDGDHFFQVPRKYYRISSDGLAVIFTYPHLEDLGFGASNSVRSGGLCYWDALKQKKLQVQVLASIKSDERLHKNRPNAGKTAPLARAKIYENPGYRKFVYDDSISDSNKYQDFPPTQYNVDDSDALNTMVTQQADRDDRLMVGGEVRLVYDGNYGTFKPGYIVKQIAGLGLVFNDPPTILRVVYDLVNDHVQVTLDNQKFGSVIKQKPIHEGQTRREHQLGLEHPAPVPGAQKVPFIEGDDASYERWLERGGK